MSAGGCVHSVHFYETHEALIDRLAGVICSGLLVGNCVLIVATSEHIRQLKLALEGLGVNQKEYSGSGRLRLYDAREMLARFMVGGSPDHKRFLASVGKLLNEARKGRGKQGLTVFGEMVAVLWEEGNKSGAIALENLWNAALEENAFHLHCAYPRSFFANDNLGLRAVTDEHTHILGLAPAV